ARGRRRRRHDRVRRRRGADRRAAGAGQEADGLGRVRPRPRGAARRHARAGPDVSGSAREVARRGVRRVEGEGAYATLALAGELARAELSPMDRGLATELAYGVLRQRSRIDRALEAMAPRGLGKLSPALRAVLRVAAYQLLFLDRIPAHAAVDDA